MAESPAQPTTSSVDSQPISMPSSAFLAGGGEMGEWMRTHEWAASGLGLPQEWPQSLKTAVRIMLTSKQAIWIGWGPDLIYFYNDPYKPIIGGKHPRALGQPVRVVWREIWEVIAPMLSQAYHGGEGTYVESQLLIMERNGYPEETYYTFSYSPIPNDDGTAGGILCANTDDTGRVLGERQLALLRELATRSNNARTQSEALTGACDALATNARDLPFALVYTVTPDGRATLQRSVGVPETHLWQNGAAAPWPLAKAIASRDVIVANISAESAAQAPTGAWDVGPKQVALIPVTPAGHPNAETVLVVGLNPFRLFDAKYRNFLSLIGAQVSASLASAQTYEDERNRAEALAALDRAKTEFFSNVSHEFRTPLTLMLGPIEDLLSSRAASPDREQLEIVHRNSLRLLKLVNTMLDFSRIEAGRVEASFVPTDLASLTAELASVFRSAIERVGLKLIVRCDPLPEPVFVDRDMWEKIVLNLLSNAFKFTLQGEIEISLTRAGEQVRLVVRDTGVGIPPSDVERVFERFHRVRDSRGRTHEGTGIGLALVQELVRLNGGTIRAESTLDAGSRFTVELPLGSSHLDPKNLRATPGRALSNANSAAFALEASRWDLPREPASPDTGDDRAGTSASGPPLEGKLGRILLADDNTDMRDYVTRLLSQRFQVTAVGDGEAALAALQHEKPDLVLSDVMMPKLDGFGLLRAMRADPALATIPIVLLSARAGEEARVEGADAGADDYLIKPFSARELVARVEAHVKMSRFRKETGAALRHESDQRALTNVQLRQRTSQYELLLERAPLGIYLIDSQFRVQEMNPTARAVFGDVPNLIGRDFSEVLRILWPENFASEIEGIFRHTLKTGESHTAAERVAIRANSSQTEYYEWRVDRIPLPDGSFGVVCYFRDITAHVLARQQLKEARDDALAANRAKDDFLATLSHELRTPLNPVLLVSSESSSDASLPDPIRADFRMIAESVSLQARLIDDLLDLSRITRGKVTLEQTSLDLHEVLRDALSTIHPDIAAKNIHLTLSLQATHSSLVGDPVRLRQVFWNILKNAVKFTPDQGLLEVTSADVGDTGDVEVSVRDSGIGMRNEELARIFNPFVQGRHADENSNEKYGGLGLGLAIARMLVERHGGSISAESPGPDLGSTITVRLPTKGSQRASGAIDERRPGSGSRPPQNSDTPALRRLLLVEDHGPTRFMLARLLKRRGYEVNIAQSMHEAIEQATRVQFDVLISDLGLPDGDGCMLMTRLRESKANLPGIAISGYGMEADIARSRSAGFEEHLIKPISIDSLDRALARLLLRVSRDGSVR